MFAIMPFAMGHHVAFYGAQIQQKAHHKNAPPTGTSSEPITWHPKYIFY